MDRLIDALPLINGLPIQSMGIEMGCHAPVLLVWIN
jgi:hypothetical protein